MINENLQKLIWQRIKQNNQTSANVACQLAKENNPVGLYETGIRYLHGWSVELNMELAIENLEKAAQQGHVGACYELAEIYLSDHVLSGVRKDLNKSQQYIDLGLGKSILELSYDTNNYNQAEAIGKLNALKKVIYAMRSMETRQNSLRMIV